MQYLSRKHSGRLIRRYSNTILFVSSMALFTSGRISAQNHTATHYNTLPLKQSMIAEFALQYDEPKLALQNYTDLAIHSDSTIAKQRALDIALDENDLNAALSIAMHWVKQDPSDVPALFYLTHISLKAHKYELTASTLDKILSIDSDADLAEILAGISPDTAADRNALLETLRKSRTRHNPSIIVLIASLEAQNNDFVQAIKDVEHALHKRPHVTSFILLKASLLELNDNQAATQAWYQQSSLHHRHNYEVRLAEVKYLTKIGQPQNALKKLQSIIQMWPQADEALFIAGLTSIDLKKYDLAEHYLLQLGHSNRYQNEANYYLAINAERKQHYETAIVYYRRVDGSLYTVSRRALMSIFDKTDRLSDALRFLTQERVNYPQHASFLYQLQANILKKQNDKRAAIELLSEAIQNLPDDPDLIYAQVLLLDPFQDRNLLEQDLNRLLIIEPNSPTYLNAYAYTLAVQNQRLRDARLYAEKALDQAPDQASILDTYGYIAFLQNDFKTAIPVLEKAYLANHNAKTGARLAKALYLTEDIKKFTTLTKQLQLDFPQHAEISELTKLSRPHLTP
ncbi:tetratricopeptide repeat protein [Acinetobacter sp. B10A]|nr:tetratricopeptide repeat protein [Acinetobacter baretiae]MBF7684338.1 tetratricopeptide repeat protein [Acinetobacter baretiae]